MVARRGEGAGGCDGGLGPRERHASPLWTLQRLCFGPDVEADPSDRGENRDPGAATPAKELQLTRETRLENHPRLARKLDCVWRSQCLLSCIRPCSAVHRPQALMVFADRLPDKWTSCDARIVAWASADPGPTGSPSLSAT